MDQNLVGEHSVKGDPESLYNLTKGDPDPLLSQWIDPIGKYGCFVTLDSIQNTCFHREHMHIEPTFSSMTT